ncbi:glycosyltransferase family 2 protein [Galbibacter mesophilus]|uniref:glycosyltransferase family 2 protein n=1 Tax=Galbibacter mesophilus TaxID=379069 RepID=UPI00191E85C9|nr:glycosyltransferase family 2 protein [Galbibacter mesophilus]MCM5663506.1 glycosyltransferase family 2 protein [Galbibacter mesophilus]
MSVALIITTYNWPEALRLVLESVKSQSVIPDEIFIADDGSGEKTKSTINEFSQKNPDLNIIHVWHEDTGYQRSKILNKTISGIKSDYIIQTDGDCILHKDFVKDHLHFSEPNQFICGNRTMLTKKMSDLFISRTIPTTSFFLHLGSKFHFKYQYRNYGLSKKKSNLFNTNQSRVPIGCNMSYWKKDVLKINGYNELFVGWGPEDAEFAQRLLNTNCAMLQIRHACIIFHIDHPYLSRKMLDKNMQIFQSTIDNDLKFCTQGIKHIEV